MAKYLKPLRGKFTSATQQDILLRKGEMFLCLVNSDNMGQGPGAIYIGDGISAFNSYTHNGSTVANTPQPFLIHPAKYNPIFANTNPSTASWTIDAATSEINNIGKGVAAVELPTIIGNIKAALCKHADSIVKLTSDRDDILDTLDDHERHLSDHDNSIATINETLTSITAKINDIYPVGSIYISTQMDDTTGKPINPSTYLGYGTWSLLAGNYVLKTITDNNKGGSTYSAENTGGTSLGVEHLPSHTHTIAQKVTVSGSGTHSHTYTYPTWEDAAAGDGGTIKTHDQREPGYKSWSVEGDGSHSHSASLDTNKTGPTGSGTAHSHESKMPRSIGVYVWKRLR